MAPYPELLWVFDGLKIDPQTAPDGFEDCWFSFLGLRVDRTIPAIPPQYRREFLDKRAIYVTGIPADVAPPEMVVFFSQFGHVDKCIVVVDMKSQVTFRWVVMTSREECQKVLQGAHGVTFEDQDDTGKRRVFILRLCAAVGPDEHITIDSRSSVDQVICEERYEYTFNSVPLNTSTTHGHPSPVAPRITQLSEMEPGLKLKDLDEGKEVYEESGEKYGEIASWPEYDKQAEGDGTFDNSDIPTVVTTPPEGFVTQAASWANIAGTANPSHQVINIVPASRVAAGPRLKPVGRIPSISGPRGGESHIQTIRVVHLLGIPNNLGLQDISNAVREGALRAIRFGINAEDGSRWAGIVFQHASEAEAFWQVLSREKAEGKPERFKCIVEAVRGDPFQQDDILRAMGPPTFASRRLTIVKSKFFFMFGEKHLRGLCEKLVGKENIQLIWLYNGGNATIVFADVESAMLVKEKLDDMAAGRGLPNSQSASTWEGLQTTFSKDPCVAPLELKTAM
jgi:RNA recognition motif-containing protein